jgi:lipopolysaccharide export LptBFGC system permease protein LptF
VVGTINERLAFSVSVFVLVILAAALGIIFRGSHMMVAFGISFVPMLFVIVMIVTGKQMSHNAATHGLGLAVMWSGIVAVAGLDVWTLTHVLRR